MSLAEAALQRFRKDEAKRIRLLEFDSGLYGAICQAARDAAWCDEWPSMHPPVERDVTVSVGWHGESVVLAFPGDDLELLVRVEGLEPMMGTEDLELEVYPVLQCSACGRKAPHGPAIDRVELAPGDGALGLVLVAGTPAAGHRCVPSVASA